MADERIEYICARLFKKSLSRRTRLDLCQKESIVYTDCLIFRLTKPKQKMFANVCLSFESSYEM